MIDDARVNRLAIAWRGRCCVRESDTVLIGLDTRLSLVFVFCNWAEAPSEKPIRGVANVRTAIAQGLIMLARLFMLSCVSDAIVRSSVHVSTWRTR